MRRQKTYHQGRPLRRHPEQPRKCPLCRARRKDIDYKEVKFLHRFISSRGKIEPRITTNLCRRHQQKLARAIKRARYLALLPYTSSHRHELS